MKAVAIIPARIGSRRIPGKNFRKFHGRSIISYSVASANDSSLFDGVWVASEEFTGTIAMLDAGWVNRWPEFSQDDVGTQLATRHALRMLEREAERESFVLHKAPRPGPEFVCCIYATAPMLTAHDLKTGYEAMLASGGYAYVHGWYYWGRADWFGVKPLSEGTELERPEDRWIDINTEDDWKRAEEMYAALHKVAA